MHPAIIRAYETGGDLSAAIEEAAAPMRAMIQQMLDRKPFTPFRISMTGGYEIVVHRPENCCLKAGTATVGRWDHSTNPPKFVERSILALIHVVSLQQILSDEPTIVEDRSDGGEQPGNRHEA